MTDRAELARLVLQIARDSAAQEHLQTLLIDCTTTVARHRQELRNLKARMARRSPKPGRST